MIVLINAQSDFVSTILNKIRPVELEGQGVGGITHHTLSLAKLQETPVQ